MAPSIGRPRFPVGRESIWGRDLSPNMEMAFVGLVSPPVKMNRTSTSLLMVTQRNTRHAFQSTDMYTASKLNHKNATLYEF